MEIFNRKKKLNNVEDCRKKLNLYYINAIFTLHIYFI